MIISLHLPKTAGTSFRKSLELQFGKLLIADYADLPLNTPVLRRKLSALYECVVIALRPPTNVKCIHGHFLPLKYSLVGLRRQAIFVTWLRDPVERLASQYHYWRKSYDPRSSPTLHKRVIEENWSLEDFCCAPELRNVYAQFLWGFPLSRFDFIGITEHYEEDFRFFTREFIGTDLPLHRENMNVEKPDAHYAWDPKLRSKIEEYHANDMALYRQALEKRLARFRP